MSTQSKLRDKWRQRIFEICLFAVLGTLMFCSKLIMEFLPNVHLLGAFTIAFTLVFRVKALIPIYINVFLIGLYGGFNLWWFPYLYIWTALWGITMLLPKKMPEKAGYVVLPLLCGLHGFAFGTLYAPAWALMMNMDKDGVIAYMISNIPFDIIHGIGNLVAGLLILPLVKLMRRLLKSNNY